MTEADPNEVESHMKDLLPPPSQFFSDAFFIHPPFSFSTVYHVATLFGCETIPNEYSDALELTQNEKSNKRFMLHVWLSFFLECNIETCKSVLQTYMATRGSTNSLVGSRHGPGLIYPPSYRTGFEAPRNGHDPRNEANRSLQDIRERGNGVTIAGVTTRPGDQAQAAITAPSP